jgi:hypothetical protein
MQRARLRTLHECVSMRLHWSIVSLDPVFHSSNPRPWEPDSYSAFYVASTRVLEIARESADFNSHARCMFHDVAIRATTALLQIILRKVTPDRTQLNKYIASCRDGIEIGRSLVPKLFARAEDIFEKLLNEYMPLNMLANCKTRHLEQLDAPTPMSHTNNPCSPPSDIPLLDNNSIYQLFDMPLIDISSSFLRHLPIV